MSTVSIPWISVAEYLARERRATTKSEYYRGEIFAMAGASREHNLIAGNLVRLVGNELLERPCEVYPADMRVKISATGLYTYPDVTVVCGEPQFEDHHGDVLLNPTVLFEVLSESTEAYDRGTKSSQYRQLPSLQELVLVAQDRYSVERLTRQPDGGWLLTEWTSAADVMSLESIGVRVALAEIYRRIEFPSQPADVPAAE